MPTVRVHPIQQNYRLGARGVVCGLCGADNSPRDTFTPARVTHMVHLVREHLAEVNRTLSTAARPEEITVELTE